MSSPDAGSFRDPASHVVLDGDRAVRVFDERGLAAFRALAGTDFFKGAVADSKLVESVEVSPPPGAAGAVEHPLLPFISYPYEWTFSMLKDAALLQLDLLEGALGAGMTMKDATPYNVQFVAGKPLFIDIGSFEPYRQGEPWIGYRQFTRQYLYPLLLRAWVGVPFQPWMRGDMEGPTPAQMSKLIPLGRRFKMASLLHVRLQARMEARMSDRAIRSDLRQAGFSPDLILANVRKLCSLIAGLDWESPSAGWSTYHDCTHVSRDRDDKSRFLETETKRFGPTRVIDLGGNDGHFSLIAAANGASVITVDGDEAVLDRLYRSGAPLSIVVTDLANPSPSQGWAGVERPSLQARAHPEMVIAYGLIHHLIYSSSVPPGEVVAWLRSFDCPVVVEFVAPEDEMVAKLIGNKLTEELHDNRDEAGFRGLLSSQFDIVSEQRLTSGTRTLFSLTPR